MSLINGLKALNGDEGLDGSTGTQPLKLNANTASRKYCKDVFMPQSSHTAIHDAKASLHQTGLQAVLSESQKLWNRGQAPINYGFVSGQWRGTQAQRTKVNTFIKEWEWYGQIHFVNVTSSSESPTSLPPTDIRIGFDPSPSEGSWSLVGTDCRRALGDQATMNLGWIDPNSDKLDRAERAVFGHALGMLHEHQSPAGGGVRLANVDAAIKFYGVKAGWSPDMVRKQVIDTYNTKDVSSFSHVDRLSIMQYPMPASVTGLPYDIDYNYDLSEMDKAYMCIMYPRARPHDSAPKWTLEHALEVAGISREDPVTANKIKAAAVVGTDGLIDPSRIRAIFSEWCLKSHVGNSEALQTLTPLPSTQDVQHTINAFPISMCSTGETQVAEPGAQVSSKGVMHAVNSLEWIELPRVSLDIAKDGAPGYARKITWAIAPCPKSLSDPRPLAIEDYQRGIVNQALLDWAAYASIEFEAVQQADTADLVFVFQKYHWSTGKEILKSDPVNRSYCQYTTAVPQAVEYDPENPSTERDSGLPQVRHTICYRAISETKAAANVLSENVFQTPGSKLGVTDYDLDMRSARHEIGHYLGLGHEDVGFYGYCIYEEGIQIDGIDKVKQELRSTKYDTGSIMDTLRLPQVLSRLAPKGFFSFFSFLFKGQDVRTLVRTVYDLSDYDRANIALLHPGKKLTSEKIKWAGLALGLPAPIINTLNMLAQQSKWYSFRKTYLDALRIQSEEWSQLVAAVIEGIQKYARRIESGSTLGSHFLSPSPAHAELPSPAKLSGVIGSDKTILDILYDSLSKTIGPTGSQILSLQFPTRYLAKDEFQYELSGVYSNFVKPVVVAEAEFRLTDALYDAAAIVSAPNGRSLSTVYNQVINNLIPKYAEADRKVREERERIRAWLLTEIGDQDPYFKFDYNTSGGGKGEDLGVLKALDQKLVRQQDFVRKMSRMEFASQLTQDYFDAQQKWELERDNMVAEAIATRDPNKLAAVTRRLVHITQFQQGKLAMKNADSVVRGYSHVVREALGHLDVATAAELLQDAKDAFRTSAVSSLYGASKVYPVLMSPVDWSAALDTGFTPEDLSENPDMIIMMIKTKASALDLHKKQLALLQSSAEGDPATLKAEVEAAAKVLNTAESNLHSKYLDSTVELAKIAIAIATDGASTVVDKGVAAAIEAGKKSSSDVEAELIQSVKKLDPMGTVDDIKAQVEVVNGAQLSLQKASSAWNSKKAALARSEATQTKSDQAFIERSIASLVTELADLNARLDLAKLAKNQSVALALKKQGQLTVGDLSAQKPVKSGGGSRWQEINIVKTQKYTEQATSVSGSSFSENWNTSFWIGSASGDAEKSDARFKTSNIDKEITLEISMRITLVTVDRSTWFQPQLFDISQGFMKGNSSMSFSSYPPNAGADVTAASIAESFRKSARPINSLPPTSLLPAFPVGYILCKDVLIKVSNMNLETNEEKRHMLERSQSSGGFLCFSYSKASEGSSDTSRATFELASDGMLVRIPGPQILGYIQQIVPKDNSIEYDPKHSLGKEFYLPPVLSPDLSKNQNDLLSGAGGIDSGAAHGLPGQQGLRDPKYAEYKFGVAQTSMSNTPKPKATTPPHGSGNPIGGSDKPTHAIANFAPGNSPPGPDQTQHSGDATHMVNGPTTTPLADLKRKSVDDLASKVQQKLALDDGSIRAAIEKALGLSPT